MLFVINPASGAKHALDLFKTKIEPILRKKGIKYDTLLTESTTHIANYMKHDFDLTTEALGIISGDGTVFHVANSLPKCPPLMIFPGGTDNGIFVSILSSTGSRTLEEHLESSFRAFIEGTVRCMNCLSLSFPDSTSRSMLSVSFGMLTDIDMMSGSPRSLTIPLNALRLMLTNPYKNDRYTIFYRPANPQRPLKPFFEKLKLPLSSVSDEAFQTKVPADWEVLAGNMSIVCVSAHSSIGKISCLLPGFSSFSGNCVLFMASSDCFLDKLKYLLNSNNPDLSALRNIEAIEVSGFRIYPPKRLRRITIDGELTDSREVHGEVDSIGLFA